MRQLSFLLLGFLFVTLFTNCEIQREASRTSGWDYKEATAEAPTPTPNDEYYGLTAQNRRIIMNGALTMKVKNLDSTVNALLDMALFYDGYVLSSSTNRSVIRVGSKHFKTVFERVRALGEVSNHNITGNDVTEEYFDLELRLENARKARARYLELLNEAATVTEGIHIEKELERLNNVIDSYEGKMKKLEHLETFATITINHYQSVEQEAEPTVKLGILSHIGVGVYKGIRWLFVRG